MIKKLKTWHPKKYVFRKSIYSIIRGEDSKARNPDYWGTGAFGNCIETISDLNFNFNKTLTFSLNSNLI